ncbi:MAG: DUF2169 domain-containing protein [Pseudomonadota bacterium]
MWQLRNLTPFAARAMLERDKTGREVWAATVKGTFDLPRAPGAVPSLAEDQPDVLLAPLTEGADNEILRAEGEIAPFLPAGEVLMRGAVRPPADDLQALPLTLSVAGRAKRAILFGRRRVAPRMLGGWRLASEEPVTETELCWTNAFGGLALAKPGRGAPDNPIGVGFDMADGGGGLSEDDLVEVPRFGPGRLDPLSEHRARVPVGFGPVPRAWPARARYAGTFDGAWEKDRAPLLPKDFDARFYHAAPEDQWQPGGWKGGEAVHLEGFLPEGDMRFDVPQSVLTFQAHIGRSRTSTRMALTRMIIDLTARQVSFLWTAFIDCNGREEVLWGGTVQLKQISRVTL